MFARILWMNALRVNKRCKRVNKHLLVRANTRASTLALLDNPDLQADLKRVEERNRKRQIIGYLLETRLIILSPESKRDKSIISLQRANLERAYLEKANLAERG